MDSSRGLFVAIAIVFFLVSAICVGLATAALFEGRWAIAAAFGIVAVCAGAACYGTWKDR